MIFGKKTATRVLQVEHTDHCALVDQRNHQLRPRLRIELDVARIAGHIGHQHRLAIARRIAHQAIADRDVVLDLHALVEAHREAMLQLFAARIQQQNRKHLEVNQLRDTVGDAIEQFVEIEDGRQLAADLIQ